jgi:hypothetical protein
MRLFNIKQEKLIRLLRALSSVVLNIFFHPSNKSVITVVKDGVIILLEISTGK